MLTSGPRATDTAKYGVGNLSFAGSGSRRCERSFLQHRLNRNFEDFQLLPDLLLGHVLAGTIDQEPNPPVYWQAVGVEARPQQPNRDPEAVGSVRYQDELVAQHLALPSPTISSFSQILNSATFTTPVMKRGVLFIPSPCAISYSMRLGPSCPAVA